MVRHHARDAACGATHGSFDLAQVTHTDELHALRPEWKALWSRVENTTPFQSPDWLVPWWEHMGSGQLLVLTLRRDDTLVGVAPFCIYTDAERDVHTLYLLGTGVSDYGDILLDTGIRDEGLTLLLDAVADCGEQWDIAELQQLRPGSALLEPCAPCAPRALLDTCMRGEACPVLTLPPSIEELSRVVPSRTLHELWYLRRRIAREGRIETEVATRETADSLLDAVFALHDARWSARGMPGVLADDAVREFHRNAARALFDGGVLRLQALRFDGQVIAALYAFTHMQRTYYYIGGFDPAYARFGPGHLIVGWAIEDAVREGAGVFDFLRGREAYKYRWGAVDRPTWQRRLMHTDHAAPAARTAR